MDCSGRHMMELKKPQHLLYISACIGINDRGTRHLRVCEKGCCDSMGQALVGDEWHAVMECYHLDRQDLLAALGLMGPSISAARVRKAFSNMSRVHSLALVSFLRSFESGC